MLLLWHVFHPVALFVGVWCVYTYVLCHPVGIYSLNRISVELKCIGRPTGRHSLLLSYAGKYYDFSAKAEHYLCICLFIC